MKLVVLSCVLMLSAVLAQQAPVVLCGRQLAQARVLLCYGSELVNKRSLPHALLHKFEANDGSWEDEWPLQGRRGALSADWSRYKKDGLADECCLKPCTTDVILNYC